MHTSPISALRNIAFVAETLHDYVCAVGHLGESGDRFCGTVTERVANH